MVGFHSGVANVLAITLSVIGLGWSGSGRLGRAADADGGNGSATVAGENEQSEKATQARFFETQIAPLLARHCLDCHDSATHDGALDLSHKATAFAGGESGKTIVPGRSAESLLWKLVQADEMPQNRAALSDAEKESLRRWIDAGAVWSVDTIQADAYIHDSRGGMTWLQRLTVNEYIETVRSAVGVDIEAEARRLLPRDERADGFTNTAYNLGVDLAHVEAYSRLAKVIVSRMDMKKFATRHADSQDLDEACVNQLVNNLGRRLLRGPLSADELRAYRQVSSAVAEAGGDFSEMTSYLVQAMLQSPRFIYRIETQVGSGETAPADGYELASRISYMLWGAPPDDELLSAAEAGQLQAPEVLREQVRRMLSDPRTVSRSRQFIHEWIDLGRLETLRPNTDRFPQWTQQLAQDMRDETLEYFVDLVWKQNRPLWELINAPFTYATPRLAHHYGLYERTNESREPDSRPEPTSRVRDGLVAFYTFGESGANQVSDVSGAGEPIDLKVLDPKAARWQSDGMALVSPTMLVSERPPIRLIESIQRSGAITLEVWLTPADTTQTGPARVLTLSNGVSARNFTLGQVGDRFEVRLRTSKSSGNGEPSVTSATGSAVAAPQHVVFTCGKDGEATIYINGQVAGNRRLDGNFSNWDGKFLLAMGNELSGDRTWQGTLHLAAIYDRALPVADVRRNHAAGGGFAEDAFASQVVAAAWQKSDTKDLLALYRFDEASGDTVRDQSGVGEPIDLRIDHPASVSWGEGGLTVYGNALISSAKPAERLSDAIKRANELTVETWVTPANLSQDGPARIVTLSAGPSQRNFTVGQDRDRYDVRLRAQLTDNNGIPSQSAPSGSVRTGLTHLVFTKAADGQSRLYVDGEETASANVGEDLGKWDNQFRLSLANETSQDRPWVGTYHWVAIYSRALSAEEVRAKGAGMTRHDLRDVPGRGGLLTHGSVLTIGGDEASMVSRGLFILHDLLYSRVGNPPPCVDTTPIPTREGLSTRGLAEVRLADSSCVGCHARFEPLAFGLEKFDGIGAYREIDEHGNRLREDGEILFPGQRQPVKYETASELMDLLAESDRVRMAITRKVTQFALGRPLVAADMPHLDQIHAAAQQQGGTYPALMSAIVMSDLVRLKRNESQ